jgi:hypothetical protein
MLYAAIDIHKRTFHAAVLDVDSGETSERRFGATREELKDWAMPLQGTLAAVAIEATNGWRWVWRELSNRRGGWATLCRSPPPGWSSAWAH